MSKGEQGVGAPHPLVLLMINAAPPTRPTLLVPHQKTQLRCVPRDVRAHRAAWKRQGAASPMQGDGCTCHKARTCTVACQLPQPPSGMPTSSSAAASCPSRELPQQARLTTSPQSRTPSVPSPLRLQVCMPAPQCAFRHHIQHAHEGGTAPGSHLLGAITTTQCRHVPLPLVAVKHLHPGEFPSHRPAHPTPPTSSNGPVHARQRLSRTAGWRQCAAPSMQSFHNRIEACTLCLSFQPPQPPQRTAGVVQAAVHGSAKPSSDVRGNACARQQVSRCMGLAAPCCLPHAAARSSA